MKRLQHLLLACLISTILTSCETFLQGMATGMGSYGGYGMGYMPTYGTGSGNLDYLLDPRYAMMQVAQQQAQMNAVNEQLIRTTVRQVNEAEQAEYQAAKKYRPNLTLEQFRREKAQAYQNVNGSGSNTRSSSSTSGSTSSSSRQCNYCNGTGRRVYDTNPPTFGLDNGEKVKCNECGQTFLKSTGHTHVSCQYCGGTGIRR